MELLFDNILHHRCLGRSELVCLFKAIVCWNQKKIANRLFEAIKLHKSSTNQQQSTQSPPPFSPLFFPSLSLTPGGAAFGVLWHSLHRLGEPFYWATADRHRPTKAMFIRRRVWRIAVLSSTVLLLLVCAERQFGMHGHVYLFALPWPPGFTWPLQMCPGRRERDVCLCRGLLLLQADSSTSLAGNG